MSHSNDDDLSAMERLTAGEDLALNEIIDRWKSRLIAYLYRYTGNQSIALDLTQETFVRVYQSRGKFRSASNFSTWLFGIAANLARQHHRWQKRHPTSLLEEADEITLPGDPSLSVESQERSTAVKDAITSLTEDLREAVILSEYENLSQAEIAVMVGCSVKAVERRLSRAREQLRKQLQKYLS